MKPEATSFLCGCAAFADMFFAVKAEENDGTSPPAVEFSVLDGEEWSVFGRTADWIPCAIATVKPEGEQRVVVAVGAKGECVEFGGDGSPSGVGKLPSPPRRDFIAQNLVVAANDIYVLGMGRAIARRVGPGNWSRFDPPGALSQDRACGFTDLVRLSSDEMYVVGWGGEIWQTDGKKWQQIDSPTSAHFRAATSMPDGSVLAVGYNGAVVRGRHQQWELVESGRSETLLDACSFGGEVYVATAFQILKLTDDGLVPVENFDDPEDVPGTGLGLYPAADGTTVFSMGPSDLFRLEGGNWVRVE